MPATASSTPPRAPAASASASPRRSAAPSGLEPPALRRRMPDTPGAGGLRRRSAHVLDRRAGHRAQHDLPVTWLIVDDGGYGILREYMVGAFGKATATELARPDFVALAESFGVPAVRVSPEDVGDALKAGFAADGPNVVVVETLLKMFGPTHLAT